MNKNMRLAKRCHLRATRDFSRAHHAMEQAHACMMEAREIFFDARIETLNAEQGLLLIRDLQLRAQYGMFDAMCDLLVDKHDAQQSIRRLLLIAFCLLFIEPCAQHVRGYLDNAALKKSNFETQLLKSQNNMLDAHRYMLRLHKNIHYSQLYMSRVIKERMRS